MREERAVLALVSPALLAGFLSSPCYTRVCPAQEMDAIAQVKNEAQLEILLVSSPLPLTFDAS